MSSPPKPVMVSPPPKPVMTLLASSPVSESLALPPVMLFMPKMLVKPLAVLVLRLTVTLVLKVL